MRPVCWARVWQLRAVQMAVAGLTLADGIHVDMNHLKKGEVK